MSDKDCVIFLVKENQKLKKENEMLQERLKQNLMKSANLITKTIEIKSKIDFYESLTYLPNDDFGKGFNNAFSIIKDLFEKKEENK